MHRSPSNATSSYDATTSGNMTSLLVRTEITLRVPTGTFLWLPYVILTVLLLALLCVSFIRFHLQNKERYKKRIVLARHENGIASTYSSAHFDAERTTVEQIVPKMDPDAVRIFKADMNNGIRKMSLPSTDDKPDPDVTSIGSCSSIMNVNELSQYSHQNKSNKMPHTKNRINRVGVAVSAGNDADMAPSAEREDYDRCSMSVVEQIDEQIIQATLDRVNKPRINCRQSLTFMKRDSRLSLYGTEDNTLSTGTSSSTQNRWVSVRNTERWDMRKASRASLVAPSVDTNVRSVSTGNNMLSFMGNRMRETGGRSVKLNMWSGRKKPISNARKNGKRRF